MILFNPWNYSKYLTEQLSRQISNEMSILGKYLFGIKIDFFLSPLPLLIHDSIMDRI